MTVEVYVQPVGMCLPMRSGPTLSPSWVGILGRVVPSKARECYPPWEAGPHPIPTPPIPADSPVCPVVTGSPTEVFFRYRIMEGGGVRQQPAQAWPGPV